MLEGKKLAEERLQGQIDKEAAAAMAEAAAPAPKPDEAPAAEALAGETTETEA